MTEEMEDAPAKTPSLPVAAIKALRPKQWAKNVLLFAALVFSFGFLDVGQWIKALWGFGCFCLVSSTGYLFNDIRDQEADAKHPRKRHRPIASGALPVSAAWAEMATIFVVGCVAAWLLRPEFLAITLLYFVSTMSYTLYFKSVVIMDIMMIAAGFLWRAAAGAIAIDVAISPWLLLCTGFFALFLGFNKRRGELSLIGKDQGTRKTLQEYTPALIEEFQAITTSGTVISYALYTVLASPTPWLLLTLPHVVYGIFRYIYLVQSGEGDSPTEILYRDRGILVVCVTYPLLAVGILLLAP